MRTPEPTDRASFEYEIEHLITLAYQNGMKEPEIREALEAQANRDVLDPL